MKTCPNCGAQNPDEAKFCPACGSKLANADLKKIEVHGYKEWYLQYSPVRIFIDDVLYGEVNHDEVKTLEIKRIGCTMKLVIVRKEFELYIPAEFEGKVLIETNRWSGRFISAVLAM